MTRFICTGDLHLGATPWLSDKRLNEQEVVWDRILDAAEETNADAVLFAGDAFEGPLATPEQIEAFIRPIEEHSIDVFAITGNGRHDSAMREHTALASLRHVPRLHVAGDSQLQAVNQAGEGYAQIAMLPWASDRQLRIARPDACLEDFIVAEAAELRRRCASGAPAVLLTHFSMTGAELPNGLPVDQLHEPVIEYADLEAQGWDAVVCGHIHRAQTLGIRGFYVGSPMPLNFGETRDQHGYWILDVGDGPTRFEFRTVESRPVLIMEASVSDSMIVAAVPGGMPPGAVVRVDYTCTEEQARSVVHQDGLRRGMLGDGAHRVFFKPTIIRAERARVAGITEQLTDEEALRAWLGSQDGGADLPTESLIDLHREYVEGLA